MCGIAGILRLTPPGEAARAAVERTPFDAIPERWLDILDESIRHRGPDGQGRFRDRALRGDSTVVDVALVHRRLSIIDHGGGAQPMVSQLPEPTRAPSASSGMKRSPGAGLGFRPLAFHGKPDAPVHYEQLPDLPDTLAVVFNGCIYNHRDLRAELQAAGHEFKTDHSDTEVLLHGWRQWRVKCARHLDGMHASALWNRADAELVVCRDGFGEKPLYYSASIGGVVLFSSCMPGLLRVLALLGPISTSAPSVAPWVRFGWNQVSPIEGTRELLPGETRFLGAEKDACEIDERWSKALNPLHTRLTAEAIDGALERAVHSRLETDVPLGAFLSGGIDSALVCSYARRLRPDLTAFTVRMPDPSYDESDVAAESARAIGIRHEVLTCDVRVAQDLTDAIRTLGLPFGDSSLLPSTWVSRSARGAIPVALTGDGGDEMFMGYDRQRVIPAVYRLSKLPQSVLRAAAASTPPSAEPRSRRARARRLLWAAAGHGYKDLAAIFPPPLDASVNATAGVHNGMTSNQLGLQGAQDLARRFDLMFYLPCDLMRKSDTASMSVALEARSPMLARELANMCMDASVDSLMPRGQRKGLLRAVARRHLPAHIVDRPKMGFAIPIGDWFRTDYGGLRTLLLDHMNSTEPFGPPSLGIDLNMAFVRQMLDEHLGTGKSGLVTRDHSQRLYMLLVLSIWAKWLGGLTLRSA